MIELVVFFYQVVCVVGDDGRAEFCPGFGYDGWELGQVLDQRNLFVRYFGNRFVEPLQLYPCLGCFAQ